ncbi:MAG: hypothetical protein LBO81_00320 [Clostridiales Family XIII bacterium]|jgi:hypothetical protein|nr:hypothetical protein [Clostridiales Family XIII bacterium]
MMKMQIVLNKEKMLKEGRHSYETITERLNGIFARHGFTQEPGGFYAGGHDNDCTVCGGLYLYLRKQDWFVPYLQTWLLYDSEEAAPGEWWGIEDLRGSGIRKEAAVQGA